MTYKLIAHRVDNGKLVFKIKTYFLYFIPLWTREYIQMNQTYKYGGRHKVWARYPSFKLPGSAHSVTFFCNDQHHKLLHEKIYDDANNILIKSTNHARTN